MLEKKSVHQKKLHMKTKFMTFFMSILHYEIINQSQNIHTKIYESVLIECSLKLHSILQFYEIELENKISTNH